MCIWVPSGNRFYFCLKSDLLPHSRFVELEMAMKEDEGCGRGRSHMTA